MNEVLSTALSYCDRGWSVIPVRQDKKPPIRWTEFQQRRATPEEIREWWQRWPDSMIGIVTGKLSGIIVIDCDSEAAYQKIQELLPDGFLTCIAKTPRGYHLYLVYPADMSIGNSAGVMPGVDVRGEGGYIIAPPSVNADGNTYRWMDGLSDTELKPATVPESLYKYISLYMHTGGETAKPHETTNDHNDHKMFEYGRRDNDLFHTANILVKGGMPAGEISQVLEHLIISWGERPDKKWIDDKIKSAFQRAERRERNIMAEVREWVLTTNGHFLTTNGHKELHLTTREEMKVANMAFLRLCEGPEPLLERYGNQRGCYRRIDKTIEFMDFENADIENCIDLRLPLDIQHKTKIFPKGVVVVAGVSGMGKTLFCFNAIAQNRGRMPIFYFNAEMGPEALKQKLSHFPISISEWAKSMKVIDSWDFGSIPDKVQPDAFNVVDYLEPDGDKPYNIHGVISAIIRRLNRGTALIAIQKKPGVTMGTGGIYSIKAATLALALDWGKIEIVKNRFRESDMQPGLNKINFEVHQGHKFVKVGDWYA